MEKEYISIFRYTWDSKQDLLELLDSPTFLETVEHLYTDLIKYYELTNSLQGVVTADAINTSIAYSASVRHEIVLIYEHLSELESRDANALADFKDLKEYEVRKRENKKELAASKWISASEIARTARVENFKEFKQLRDNYESSHKKKRYLLKLLDNLKLRSDELRTISSNARTEFSNINIDSFALSLEQQALDDIQERRQLLEMNKKRYANSKIATEVTEEDKLSVDTTNSTGPIVRRR